ncbi:hypothetical protein N665_0090s0037, partial [Sinapis alba]
HVGCQLTNSSSQQLTRGLFNETRSCGLCLSVWVSLGFGLRFCLSAQRPHKKEKPSSSMCYASNPNMGAAKKHSDSCTPSHDLKWVFFSALKSGKCSSVVEARLLRFWKARNGKWPEKSRNVTELC